MKKMLVVFCGLLLALVCFNVSTASAEPDRAGSKDHPLLSRMSGFYISEYEERDFDAFDFSVAKSPRIHVEGHKYRIQYQLNKDEKPRTSLLVKRNAQSALKKIGGEVVYDYGNETVAKILKNGAETWVFVLSGDKDYSVLIIDKAAMDQEMVANADAMGNDISTTGHVSIYGIYFDTGKAEIKPESNAAIAEIAKLLKNNNALKVYVVGHTDNVGSFDANMKLSKDRADAVAKMLVSKHGIAAARLKAYGVSSLSPVSSNKTEEGKAKNRRVELVEQ